MQRRKFVMKNRVTTLLYLIPYGKSLTGHQSMSLRYNGRPRHNLLAFPNQTKSVQRAAPEMYSPLYLTIVSHQPTTLCKLFKRLLVFDLRFSLLKCLKYSTFFPTCQPPFLFFLIFLSQSIYIFPTFVDISTSLCYNANCYFRPTSKDI